MHEPHRHPGFSSIFSPAGLTLGVFFPIEAYRGDVPTMVGQEQLARAAEQLGFAALWFRDVPLRDPSFGDVGQIYDPWVYLGHIGALTKQIALATGAIVLPLRHPLHVAKAAASVDRLSGGRLVLGVASGDRAVEYAAFGVEHATRDAAFREHLTRMRAAWAVRRSEHDGTPPALDALPKPTFAGLPVLIAGKSQQTLKWIAGHADGMMTYPRGPAHQRELVATLRSAALEAGVESTPRVGQSLYIDLLAQPDAFQGDIHLGYALGRKRLLDLLFAYQAAGIEHVALNLKYGRRPASEVLEEIGMEVLPQLSAHQR